MALDEILLGFLESPASGYDLKKSFDESVRHFWDAKLSQIYPTLHRLRDRGFVTVTTRASEQGPDRKVYSRTEAGAEELWRWLGEGPRVENQRVEHLAQLFFLGQVDDEEQTRVFIEDLRAQFVRRAEVLRAIEAHHRAAEGAMPDGLTHRTVHPFLTLRYGVHRTEATIAWCDECLELLDDLSRDEVQRSRA